MKKRFYLLKKKKTILQLISFDYSLGWGLILTCNEILSVVKKKKMQLQLLIGQHLLLFLFFFFDWQTIVVVVVILELELVILFLSLKTAVLWAENWIKPSCGKDIQKKVK